MAALTDAQLEAIIAQQIELAKNHETQGGRATTREKALDYYFGNMNKYVPPEPNRSKVVSRDVADTVGWLMPQIMRVYTAGGRMFVAEPVEVEDLDYADEVSDGLNYVFWKDNKGYEVVYAATWDSLVHGDGIVKTYFDDAAVYGPPKYHDDLSEDELALHLKDDAVEVLAQTEKQKELLDAVTGEPSVAKLYDIKARHKKADGRICVEVIPPEEFLIDADATSLEDAAFKAHWQRKTRSALVEMGYPKDVVWSIPEASRNETPEEQARRLFTDSDAPDRSMELVDYFECYPMIDADGDGVAEMLRVCYAGNKNGKLLDWEVWEDEDPFDNIPCEPIPHRWESRSVTDEETDIQDVKTVLTRQLLNNTYWVNNPQNFVLGKVRNPEALDEAVFGSTVFGENGSTITPIPRQYIGDKALLGINYMDEVSARRTGVNSQTMALDPEVLQNQSATANQNATDASRSQPELIARNMAEYGWSKVGRKLLRLLTAHRMGPRVILVKGKPVPIDPANWNPDMHVSINVGLGTGSRDRDATMLNAVLNQQIAYTDRIGVVFPEKAIDMLPYVHNTLTRFAESTGLKNPELYWPEIDEGELEQGKQILAQRAQQPDPKIQLGQEKAKADIAIQQQKMQAEQAKSQREFQLKQMQLQAELQLKREQLSAELQLKREQMTAELALQRELGHANAAAKVESARTSAVRPGGEPG